MERVGWSQVAALLRMNGWSARLARGAGALTLVQTTGIAVAYVSQILFARWMGPHEYGAYAYVVGWMSLLAALPTLGLPDAMLRFVPEYAARQDWERLRGAIRASWRISLAAGAVLASGGTATVLLLDRLVSLDSGHALILGLWAAPLLALVGLQTALARGLTQSAAAAFAPGTLVRPLLVLLGAAVLVMARSSLTSVSLLGATALILPLVLLIQLGMVRGALPSAWSEAHPIYETRGWLRVAFPLLLVSASSLATTQAGLLVVGTLAGSVDAGLYNAATRTASLMALVPAMANAVAAPHFAALYTRGDRPALQALTAVTTQWGFWTSAAIATGFMFLAEPILALFGDAFVAAGPVVAILVIGQLVNTGAGPVSTLLNMTGHHHASLRVTATTAAMSVVLSVVGVRYLGTTGAALAAALALAVRNLWLHRMVARELGIEASICYPLMRRWG